MFYVHHIDVPLSVIFSDLTTALNLQTQTVEETKASLKKIVMLYEKQEAELDELSLQNQDSIIKVFHHFLSIFARKKRCVEYCRGTFY